MQNGRIIRFACIDSVNNAICIFACNYTLGHAEIFISKDSRGEFYVKGSNTIVSAFRLYRDSIGYIYAITDAGYAVSLLAFDCGDGRYIKVPTSISAIPSDAIELTVEYS